MLVSTGSVPLGLLFFILSLLLPFVNISWKMNKKIYISPNCQSAFYFSVHLYSLFSDWKFVTFRFDASCCYFFLTLLLISKLAQISSFNLPDPGWTLKIFWDESNFFTDYWKFKHLFSAKLWNYPCVVINCSKTAFIALVWSWNPNHSFYETLGIVSNTWMCC